MADLEALVAAVALKRLARTGWVRRGVSQPESVAAHSWGVAWLALALAPASLDRERLLTYAVLHDLPEVWIGDLTPADGVPRAEKALREDAAMVALTTALARPDLLAAFRAYEAQADAESQFIRECDRLDMAIQALAYFREGNPGMREFVDSAGKVLTTPSLVAVWSAILKEVGGL